MRSQRSTGCPMKMRGGGRRGGEGGAPRGGGACGTPPPRPPVAQDRLRRTGDGRVRLTLKTPWADGTRHLLFEPLAFLGKARRPDPALARLRASVTLRGCLHSTLRVTPAITAGVG